MKRIDLPENITFLIKRHVDDNDIYYSAYCTIYSIHTQADTIQEVYSNISDAVSSYFDGDMPNQITILNNF